MTSVTSPLAIRHAQPHEEWAVQELFGALHASNTALDPRFALAAGWEDVLHEHLAHTRAAGHGLTLLAWDHVTPMGLVMLDDHSDSPLFLHRRWAELLALYVAPEAQGCGVADTLLDAGIAWAGERGYERVQLYVTATNVRAKRFYARAGFRPVQEIWRRELGAAVATPPDDPICDAAYANGHDLLSVHPHHLVPDEGCEDER
jgi:ribosomal protein S18 acetylase RimI-like enzyme